MNKFQLLFLPILFVYGVFELRNIGKQPLLKSAYSLRWFIVLLAAFVVIADPTVSSYVAGFLGISRGSDVVVYTAILVLLFKLKSLSSQVDKLKIRLEESVRKTSLENRAGHAVKGVDGQK